MINQNRQGLTIQAFRSELIRGRLNFLHQDLSNLDFTNAIDLLDDKILILNGSCLNFANFTNVNLGGCFLNETQLAFANLSGANFKETAIEDSYFYRSIFSQTNFSVACLQYTIFYDNFLDEVKFKDGCIDGAEFYNCKLIECDMENLTGCFTTKFSLSVFRGVDMSRAVLIGSNFENCTISNSNFFDSCLSSATFKDCTIVDTNFQNAVFLRTKFSKSNLTNADFSNAYLSGAEFDNTNLSGAIFKGVIEATFSQNGDRFRFIFGEDDVINYEDQTDFRPYEHEENDKIKIKEGCKTFNYLLESGALTKDQLKQMLGPISEENGRSAVHNFLEQFSYQINEQGLGLEIEEQIYALMAKVREVDQRIRPEELSEIEENETEETNEIEEAEETNEIEEAEETNEIEEAEETNEGQEATFDNNLEISFENLLEQIASNENQIMITEFDIANDFSMGTEEYEEHHFKNDGATNAQSQEIMNEIAQIESRISNDLVSFGSIRVGNRIKNEENENLAIQSSEELENQSDKKRKNSPNTSPGGQNARSFQSEEKKIKIENEGERL